MNSKLTGLIAAPFTPFQPGGELNLNMIDQQAASLTADGVIGVFVCGTTGEGLSLTTAERMQVAERWMKSSAGRLKIIVHVGHNSLGDCQELARHAAKIEADAFAAVSPSFFRPVNVEQLADFCAEVAKAAPGLPFYYYHIPVMTNVNLPMIDFVRLAAKRIPNFAGLKFTDENLMSYSQCLNFESGRFNILFGRDEILLAALSLGATGAVGSTYNFMAPLYLKLKAAFERGDLVSARRFQSTAIEIIAVMSRHGGLPAGKAMMKMIGVDCGPVRPPLQELSVEGQNALRVELERVGFPSAVTRGSQAESAEITREGR
jgi:N-acetylneuraminate lyase